MKDKLPLVDWGTVFAGAFILAASIVMLYANYRQFEIVTDLKTACAITTAYFVASITKRIIRVKQREKRETEKE